MNKTGFVFCILAELVGSISAQSSIWLSKQNDLVWQIKDTDAQTAIVLLDSIITMANRSGALAEEAKAWNTKGHVWGVAGQYDACYSAYTRAKRLRLQILDHSGIAGIYNNIANFKFNEGKLGEALLMLDTAVLMCRQVMDIPHLNDSLHKLNLYRLGVTYQTMSKVFQAYNEPLEAVHSARLGRQFLSKLPNRANEQMLADYTLANSFYCLYTKTEQGSNADSALFYYKKVLRYYQSHPFDADWMAKLYHNCAVIELGLKHFDNAWTLLAKSENIATAYDDSLGIFSVLLHKSLWLEKKEQYKESLAMLKQAQTLRLKQVPLDDSLFFCYLLAESYEKNGMLDSALLYQKIAYDLRDRLLSEDKNQLLQKFKLKEKELEVRDEKARADKHASKALWFKVLSGLLGILAALLVLVLRQKAKLNYLKGSLQGKEKALDSLSKRLHEEVQVYMNAATNSIANAQQHLSDLSVAATQLGFAKNKLRDISHDIGTTILKHVGIHATLEELCERISDREGELVAEYEQSGITQRLPFDLELTVFRLAHLLTDNTLKHAKARSINMKLTQEPDGIVFKYGDDGVGFDFHKALLLPNSSGLKEIQDLAQNIRAKMTVDQPPGGGIQFSFLFPQKASKGLWGFLLYIL